MTETSTILSAPVVLVHGLCLFGRFAAKHRPAKEYFPGVRGYLEALGNRVYVPRVSPTARIATRAAELKAYLRRELGGRAVHLVGHSLGGLDARYMISRLGMAGQVLSLTTIGTPHHGTAFADWAEKCLRVARPFIRTLGSLNHALFDLTTDACRRFNELVPDAPGVLYRSVAGVCEKPYLGPEWAFPSRIVGRAEGPNDGVVSVASATWGEQTEQWVGDHLNLVNWPNRLMRRAGEWHDRAADYGRLLGGLATA
ncbi:lipase family alpha/beta hydrolase [Fimbriiglobus ruber]|uniref:Lipase n=1 Tax=Fimbriiglobus ruber TaxID=1908690 RepID=A0A225DEL4_9BACT|nr:alpha/beta hydrolase [Fimbriiglobus ruber]OWK36958.1 Lipase precursor [Fimbriiglobus ruber]